jgi:hypothetical protein
MAGCVVVTALLHYGDTACYEINGVPPALSLKGEFRSAASYDELRAALRLARAEIRKLNFGRRAAC